VVLFIFLGLAAGCRAAGGGGLGAPQPAGLPAVGPQAALPSATVTAPAEVFLPAINSAVNTAQVETPAPIAAPSSTNPPAPTETEAAFEVGREITIEYLRELEISGSEITFERQIDNGPNYFQHIVSYISEGNRIYGLLTIPFGEPPAGGFKAIVFNHGYIPPGFYQTTERYIAYVDYLARSGFVVFKIDLRGHGNSEGEPEGSYFSPGYTIDAIAALKSLQLLDMIDPQGIGMWGHSMAGNLVLRAMLVEPDVKAGVIWAGAVYSYDDFVTYGIDDNTYRPPPTPTTQGDEPSRPRRSQEIFEAHGRPDTQVAYWQAVSLTENIAFLSGPLQLHHAEDDSVVNIGYSSDLAAVLQANGKPYEFYSYAGGGHNLVSPYFDQAIIRTVEFFRKYL
jgi:fermentation-respiration switch protein FrsA (DUF1100 family)